MLTCNIPAILKVKKTIPNLLTNTCRFLLLVITLFLLPLSVFAVNQRLPQALPDAGDIETSPAAPAINTPEYVIIRSNDETMFSSETTGQVILLAVKEGSSFLRGDTLLKLDCRLQQAELAKAKAQQAATTQAMESAKKLKGYGTISDFEFIKAKSESDAADAEVQKLTVVAEKCTVVAPFTGGVSEIKVHLYETVKPGDPLLKVVNTENLTFELQVPSTWLSWLRVGSAFRVHINDIDRTVPAKVALINPEIEPISQTVKIVGLVSPPNPLLRPGMTGQAIFKDNPDRYRD